MVQIDSVNVLVRSHYLPAFSRTGAYDRDLLDGATYRRRHLFEYWGHEASLLPVALHPLLRWRMARAAAGVGAWGRPTRLARDRPDYIAAVLAEVTARGPVGAGELEQEGSARGGPWWGWRDSKVALEWLFWIGAVTTAGRRGFERLYDLPERVLPSAVLNAPTPPERDAQRELVRIAARACGVATETDLRDYFRMPVADCRARVAELVEAGELLPVTVAGWRQQAYLDPAARRPRRVEAAALLSPFDSLIWERSRTERLFGFRFRLEIYTPAARRVHGYYVLPFLLDEGLVARVDLKADRAASRLLVRASHLESSADAAVVAPALARELRRMAGWLGLRSLQVERQGELAPSLGRALDA